MSEAKVVTGILLKMGDGASPEVFTDIAEVVSLTPPAQFRNTIDVTNHNEGEDAFLTGIKRKEPLAFRVNWLEDDPTHDATDGLVAAFDANEKRNYKLVWPSGIQQTFAAYVSRWAPVEATVDAAQQADVVLAIAGTIVTIFP